MLVNLRCPAKINLFLEVKGKRPDGYHQLATLFAKIDWCDLLSVEASPAEQTEISLQITGPLGANLTADNTNLACRAARAFLDHFNLSARCHIKLEKHIPMGAGLGGGSSDAAGVIKALCQVFNKTPLDCLPFAAGLGADVAVFLYPQTFLKGEGIGEILTPLYAKGPLPFVVLAYPKTAVSTKDVFKRLVLPSEQEALTNILNLDKIIEDIRCGRPLSTWKGSLFNRLERFVFPFVKSVLNVKQVLTTNNQDAVLMSGSGSTVFALVDNRQQGNTLVNILKKNDWIVFLASFEGEGDENNGNKNSSYGRGTSKSICQRNV